MEVIASTYIIPEENLATLKDKLAKLARKAAKLGDVTIGLSILEREERVERGEDGWDRARAYYHVVVTGPAPRINGWEFIATLEHDPEGTIVRAVPGMVTEGELATWRSAEPWCSHCGLKRNRIDTFILRAVGQTRPGEKYKQIGRNCLRDFLGHDSPEDLARMAEYLIDAGDLARGSEGSYGSAGSGALHIDGFMALTATLVRRLGFVPRSKAEEWGKEATANQIDAVMEDNFKHGHDEDKAECSWRGSQGQHCQWERVGGHIGVTAEDKALAAAALEWIRAMEPDGLSDYMFNLYVACKGEAVPPRRYGIAASLVAAYARHMDRLKEREEKAKADPILNEWVGQEGQRLDLMGLTVLKVTAVEGQYGVSHLHVFKDKEGRRYKWFSSGAEYAEGDVLDVTATIKGHELYQDRKQTGLTRVTIYVSPEEKKAKARLRRELKAQGYEEGHCTGCWHYGMVRQVEQADQYASYGARAYCHACLTKEQSAAS